MLPEYLAPYATIQVQAVPEPGPTTQIQITLAASPEKPGAGLPGKETGDTFLVENRPAEGDSSQTLVVALGPPEKINLETLRRAGGAIARWLAKTETSRISLGLGEIEKWSLAGGVTAFCEGLFLGAFSFNRYKSESSQAGKAILQLASTADLTVLQAEIDRVEIICAAVNLARDWSHEPANVINPLTLGERALALATQSGLKCTILDEGQLEILNAGAILAVGRGSQTPSRLIILEYPGSHPAAGSNPVALVGKALTFDTGGYSIKSSESIRTMKYDKCGGVVVIATLAAAAALKLPTPLVGVVGAAENMISARAYRPDDILKTLSGKTVEIISTDAEGRLVLADSLTYLQQNYHPQAIIDLATLTGACVVALGSCASGIMTNDTALTKALQRAGERCGERLWELPLWDEYGELMKSDIADLKNAGGPQAGTISAGWFLKQFVDKTRWAHLDIAGTAWEEKGGAYTPKGATGVGVRLIIEYLRGLASGD